jgi:hypothetical protein
MQALLNAGGIRVSGNLKICLTQFRKSVESEGIDGIEFGILEITRFDSGLRYLVINLIQGRVIGIDDLFTILIGNRQRG